MTFCGLLHKQCSAAAVMVQWYTILARSLPCSFLIHAWGAQASAKGSLWCILWAFGVALSAVDGRLRGKVSHTSRNILLDLHKDVCTCLYVLLTLISSV